MSALAKPMIHSTATVVSPSSMVSIENLKSIYKADTPNRVGGAPSYTIGFLYKDGASKTVWKFATSAARNTEYTRIITLASAVLV
tara:strand:+ start:841 stop:1095 length:255 start_codon:yes stop_codon:yes gene_type:complete